MKPVTVSEHTKMHLDRKEMSNIEVAAQAQEHVRSFLEDMLR